MTATAVGLDFSCATRVIFAEVPPTVDVLQQAEGRAHRAKTKSTVNSHVLLCERSRDVRAWLRLSESLERTASLIETEYKGAGRGTAGADSWPSSPKLCAAHSSRRPLWTLACTGLEYKPCWHRRRTLTLCGCAAFYNLCSGVTIDFTSGVAQRCMLPLCRRHKSAAHRQGHGHARPPAAHRHCE